MQKLQLKKEMDEQKSLAFIKATQRANVEIFISFFSSLVNFLTLSKKVLGIKHLIPTILNKKRLLF
jgi:hypothetical protein